MLELEDMTLASLNPSQAILDSGDSITEDGVPPLNPRRSMRGSLLDRTMIYERYYVRYQEPRSITSFHKKFIIYNWLISELDTTDGDGFGYVMKGILNEEWTDISAQVIRTLGARKDYNWKPMSQQKARNLLLGYLCPVGTAEHFSWWKYEHQDDLREYLNAQKIESNNRTLRSYGQWYYDHFVSVAGK